MYETVTHDVRVRVTPRFLEDESNPQIDRFFWAYTIEIVNLGTRTIQLLSRHWYIVDGNGRSEEVHGAGVVGEQPILSPGDTFTYTSGCPLTTPDGTMSGNYEFTDETGSRFLVDIPAFSLDSPYARRVTH